MARQVLREWVGLQHFPGETQSGILALLGKLYDEKVRTLTILVMGKGGVGKSSTMNSILCERVVDTSGFQAKPPRTIMATRSDFGITLKIIDPPELVEAGYVNEQVLDLLKRFVLDRSKTIDVLLYVDRLDEYRVDNLDWQIVKAITDTFGKQIWRRGIVALTHAQMSPPDGLSYDEFVSKRSAAILEVVRHGIGMTKSEFQKTPIPVVLVENSELCNKNENDQKILPNGVAWIPGLFQKITEVALNRILVDEPNPNETEVPLNDILVDKKMVDGPNPPNESGKSFIPLILAFQEFVENWIRADIRKKRFLMISLIIFASIWFWWTKLCCHYSSL